MTIQKATLCLAACLGILCSSCSKKTSDLQYFVDVPQELTVVQGQMTPELRIAPGDELYISISSSVPTATAVFNLPMDASATTEGIISNTFSNQKVLTYIVDSKGDIQIPILGEMHVAGLTTEQLQQEITKLVSRQVDDPVVRVQLMNFRVNVMGEVARPGSVKVARERYTVLDALADAGDLTEFGERNNVLLIRQLPDGRQERVRLNLNSAEVLTSPYFFLQPNDAIYVTPNAIRADNAKYNTNNSFKISVVSTIVSGISVITSLVIALTVK